MDCRVDRISLSGSCIDTVRALHQTINSLREALEESRSEISELKSRKLPIATAEDAVKNLSIENHLLRRKLINNNNKDFPIIKNKKETRLIRSNGDNKPKDVRISTENLCVFNKNFRGLTSPTKKGLGPSKTVSFSNIFEGEKQIQTSSTLRIKDSLEKLGEGLKDDSQTDKYLIFKEELVKSKISCSTSNLPKKGFSSSKLTDYSLKSPSKSPERKRRSSVLGKEIEAALNSLNKSTKLDEPPKRDVIENIKVDVEETKTLKPEKLIADTAKKSDEDVSLKESVKKSLKEVEVSVTISKKPKQPIEIDIQTKSKRKSNKMSEKKNVPVVPPLDLTTLEDEPENIDLFPDQNDLDQDVDDIELIFTTDETKDTDFKEELAPIENYTDTLQCPSEYDDKLSISDRELEDDVFNDNFENENQENLQTRNTDLAEPQIYASKSDNSINHDEKSFKSYYSYQDSSFENKSLEKDESFDRFEEKVRIVETDMSKIGIQDTEYNLGRRNTCPNPIQYRPIMHREALGRNASSRKTKPVLAHVNVRKDSGAQTDISAIPGSAWRSESSLAHKVKVGENFTTLPSKFPHPGSRLRLSEKTVEARRILLSDIGFTSMVPELSRSADHLCNTNISRPVATSYGQFLRTTDLYSPAYTSQRFAWTTTTPSEGSYSQSRYSSQYPLSPPMQSRRCSAPVSPSKRTSLLKSTPSRVRFANGSLPELRTDWGAGDSGDSTDSLVEEAEHYLRRSIDCVAPCHDNCFKGEPTKVHGTRRASAPEPARDNVPPPGWQPFLPRMARDLHLDYWVKVISPEGRVRGGRVRYVGPLMNQPESFIGVQLSTPDGQSDGTNNNRRYFNCEPYHGLFVPFKKIIMGWRP